MEHITAETFGKQINKLALCLDKRSIKKTSKKLLLDEVKVNFNMFGTIMLNRIIGNANSGLVIIVETHR